MLWGILNFYRTNGFFLPLVFLWCFFFSTDLTSDADYHDICTCNFYGGPVLVKIMTIKLHYKSISIPLQQIIWTCCIFLSSLNNTFFNVLVIIFSNMSYFCFNPTNTFFIHTLTYFSVVLRIIFLMCIENYFFIGPRIIFRGIANLFLSL